MRFITALAGLGKHETTLYGTPRMNLRPMQDLIDGLMQMGVEARSVEDTGCPPLVVGSGRGGGGEIKLRCSRSSQFLSALLLIAPKMCEGLKVDIIDGPVSRPYVDMTIAVMETFGIDIQRDGYRSFRVRGHQNYRAGTYKVEPDCSQAGYFWAAAAILGGRMNVAGIGKDTHQGDVGFTTVLSKMGCGLTYENNGITVSGPERLKGIQIDMSDLPDMVPTLAVVAAFAEGKTVIENVAHLRDKESDRLTAVVKGLNKMGVDASSRGNRLEITGGVPRGAEIETYQDHRIAMSFAIAGLRVPGVMIKGEECVNKSFPDFWTVLDQL